MAKKNLFFVKQINTLKWKGIYTEMTLELNSSFRSWHNPRVFFLKSPINHTSSVQRHTCTHTCSQRAKGGYVQGRSARRRQKVNSSDHFNENATINRNSLTCVTFYRDQLGDLLTFRVHINNGASVWIQIILTNTDTYLRGTSIGSKYVFVLFFLLSLEMLKKFYSMCISNMNYDYCFFFYAF